MFRGIITIVAIIQLDTLQKEKSAECETGEQLSETIESKWLFALAIAKLIKVAVFTVWSMFISI